MRSSGQRRATSGLSTRLILRLVLVLGGLVGPASALLLPPSASAQAVLPAQPRVGSGRVYKEVRTVFDMRWNRLVRQTRDVSCAAASLATLRTYYFRQRTNEEDALRDLFRVASSRGTAGQANDFGFSMLDMRDYLGDKGFDAQGFAADPQALEDLPIPVIVLVVIRGFPHYVVLKGVRDKIVYLADPLFGNISMKLSTFAQAWEGVFLAAIRRGKPLPVFNPLSVTQEDRIGVEEDEIDRIASVAFTRFGILRLPNVLSISTARVTPVPGLQNVLPAIFSNHVEFQGWGG